MIGWTVNVVNEDRIPNICHEVIRACSEILSLQGEKYLDLAILNQEDMRRLNFQTRKKNESTDVLSFPSQLPSHMGHLGDIAVCLEEFDKGYSEHRFAHILLHGFLHLLGYVHETEIDARYMEMLESEVLLSLGIPDPYA